MQSKTISFTYGEDSKEYVRKIPSHILPERTEENWTYYYVLQFLTIRDYLSELCFDENQIMNIKIL
jgi:hypothetical protein